MPANYYRADVRFSTEVSSKLNCLKQEIYEKTGMRVSRSRLVHQIVSDFFEKTERSAEKTKLSSQLAIMNKKSR